MRIRLEMMHLMVIVVGYTFLIFRDPKYILTDCHIGVSFFCGSQPKVPRSILAVRKGEGWEDGLPARTDKWLMTMVIGSPQFLGLRDPFQMAFL